jgi:hypothetical protein
MNRELYRLLFNQSRAITIGEAVKRAKTSISDSGYSAYMDLAWRSEYQVQLAQTAVGRPRAGAHSSV